MDTMTTKRYRTIDEGREPFTAEIGDATIVFTRALSANVELALAERGEQSADEARDFLVGVLAHMAPGYNGELSAVFDQLDTGAILTLIGDAAKALRAVPFTEAPGSSPPVVTAGATGPDAQASQQPISTS